MPITADYLTLQISSETKYVVPVRAGAGGLDTPERQGETVRMYDNSLRSSEDAMKEKRVWKFTTAPIPSSEWDTLSTKLAARVLKANGWAINRTGTNVNVWATLNSAPHEADGNEDFAYTVTFTLQEI